MRSPAPPASPAPEPGPSGGTGSGVTPMDPQALLDAMRELLQPIAELAVNQGMLFATVEELLKTAFVSAARSAHGKSPGDRAVSRISTVTGLNRREVTRLTQTAPASTPPRASPATRVFTRWLSDPAWRSAQGDPIALPRQGASPSFESLAQSVTRDVHPRSLLEELCRLGLARLDGDMVHVASRSFVPQGDSARMLGFLGSNVGDHLRAAVANVLADKPPHVEQAVFADGLSEASLEAARELVRTQWQNLLAGVAPSLQRMIDADAAAGAQANQRVRIGLYSYTEPTDAAAKRAQAGAATPPARRVAPAKKGKST